MTTNASRALLPIPISSAEAIAKKYGYDQVVILARRVGVANTSPPTGSTRRIAMSLR